MKFIQNCTNSIENNLIKIKQIYIKGGCQGASVCSIGMAESKDLARIEEGTQNNDQAATAAVPLVVEYPEIRLKFSENAITATCPFCHQSMVTDLETKPGPFSFLSAVILAHCLLCCVPFLVDRFKDVKHNCPKCKSSIGVFKRM